MPILSRQEVEKRLNGAAPTAITKTPTPQEQVAKPGFFSDALDDITGAATGIKDSLLNRSDRFNKSVADTLQGKQSVGTAAKTLVTQALRGVGDITGGIAMGAGKAVLPQGAEDAIASVATPAIQSAVNSAPVKSLVDWYHTLDPDTQASLDLAAASGEFALNFAGGGAASKATGVATDAASMTATAAKQAVAAPVAAVSTGVKSVGKYTAGRLPKLLGIFSGENDDVIKFALQNPSVANIGIANGDDALRKVVEEGAQNSLKIRDAFIKAHTEAKKKILGEYTKVLMPKNDVKGEFNKLLKSQGVKVSGNELDFSTSKLIANPGEIKKIQDAWTALNQWDKFTISSLDDYKQLVGQLRRFADESGVPSKSPFLGQLYNKLNEIAVAKLPKDVSEKYRALNQNFSSKIDMYDDIVDAFNSGDPFTKLANALGKNKDSLRQVVQFYEKESKKSVLPVVAGRELAMEKNAAFGLLNPRSWIDLLVSPEIQGKAVTAIGRRLPKP